MIDRQDQPDEWQRKEPLSGLDELDHRLGDDSFTSSLLADLGADATDVTAEIGYASNPEPGMYDAAYLLYVVPFPHFQKVYALKVFYVD